LYLTLNHSLSTGMKYDENKKRIGI